MRRTLVVGVVLLVIASLTTVRQTVLTTPAAPPHVSYMSSSAPVDQRVDDLMQQMTLAEKVGQMDQQEVTQVGDTSNTCTGNTGFNQPNPVCMQKIFVDDHTGSVLAGGTDIPPGNTGKSWADEYNTIQAFAIQHTRLHIPVIFGVDAVHGFGHPFQAPLFPQSIGMGATWDPAAATTGGTVTANALRATGWNWDFAPVQDLSRDNRWGRTYETWAEEPALSAAMGGADVKGLQGNAPAGSLGVAATIKHFAGYSDSVNGHDRVEAQVPLRYLQDIFLPSYAGGLNAGADTVMVDSGSIDGIPATASHTLLTDILRGRLGFKGVVISDFGDVPALQTAYHVAADLPGAVAKAVNAGIDVSMEPFHSERWQSAILQDVNTGAISRDRIDQSVRRILTLKFRLGLFDQPCVTDTSKPCVNANAADAAVQAGRDATRAAANESITLLRNVNGTLPLPASSRVVVTGPSADSMTNQLGGWSVSWQGVDGAGHVCCMGPPGQIPPGTTVLKGMQARDPNTVFAPDQASAVAAAPSADAIVAAVGEKAYAEGLGDNPQPQLTPDQKALIAALEATGKPVIVVVIAGRPIGLGPGDKAQGILMAWQGSTEAGAAVADAIFGITNPSGHLPVSWPSDAAAPGGDFCGGCPSPLGDQPKVFDQLPGTAFGQGNAYNPLFPFGFGLSYSTFTTSGLTVSGDGSPGGTETARFTVTNTGTRAGTAVVPVYVSQPVSDVVAPPQRLVGFARVALAAGESKTVEVRFAVSALAVTPGDVASTRRPAVEPGSYSVVIDKNTTTPYQVAQSAPFTVSGEAGDGDQNQSLGG